jgi:hypothetical protein
VPGQFDVSLIDNRRIALHTAFGKMGLVGDDQTVGAAPDAAPETGTARALNGRS